uniref:GRANULINS domain-containing protein n=1 Tax=Ascaris lumbricoides TaxID=6252 RepID=A0A0M3I8C3_ASCLU
MVLIAGIFRNECTSNADCGHRFTCCGKQWCDLSDECGFGFFCLPNCELTKMTHLASSRTAEDSLVDLIYD